VSLDCVIYCAFYSILFRGAFFSRTRCILQLISLYNLCFISVITPTIHIHAVTHNREISLSITIGALVQSCQKAAIIAQKSLPILSQVK